MRTECALRVAFTSTIVTWPAWSPSIVNVSDPSGDWPGVGRGEPSTATDDGRAPEMRSVIGPASSPQATPGKR